MYYLAIQIFSTYICRCIKIIIKCKIVNIYSAGFGYYDTETVFWWVKRKV